MRKVLFLISILLSIMSMFAFTPQDDINLRNFYAIWNGTSVTADNFTGEFIGNLTGSLAVSSDVNYNDNDLYNATNVNATNIYQAGNVVLDSSDEVNLNVNSSTFWSGVSSFSSNWFYDLVNVLTFNDTKMNATIDTKVTAATSTSGRGTFINGTAVDVKTSTCPSGNFSSFNGTEFVCDFPAAYTAGTGISILSNVVNVLTATCPAGNFSSFNGTEFVCLEPTAAAGDITAVNTAGKYLSGGATSGAVNLLVNETEFNTTYLNTVDEGNLNVNSSNYWDTLNAVEDIVLNWTQLQNYPSACPADTFVTQIGDAITCTAISDVYLSNTGDTATGNYTFDTTTLFIDSNNNRIGIGTAGPTETLHVVGNSLIDGNVNITGTLTLGSDLTVATNGNFQGNMIIDGNLTVLGTQINASVENQYLNGSFLPNLNNQFNIGGISQMWMNGYFDGTVHADIDASNITSGTLATARIPDNYVLNTGDTVNGALIVLGLLSSSNWSNVSITTSQLSNYVEADLNVNSSNYWDLLNTPADITGLDSTNIDDIYLFNTGDSLTGSLNMTNNTVTNIQCLTFESGGQICTG